MTSPCPLCSGSDRQRVGDMDSVYTLHKCHSCGFVFTTPRPSVELLMEFYNQHSDYNTAQPPLTPQTAKEKAAHYAGLIKKHHPRAKAILEIGCLYGHLLFGLRQWGYEVSGADVCDSARLYAKDTYQVPVHAGEFPDVSLHDTFDVVILSHVIEHIVDPVDFVKRARYFLRPGGILLLETPGLDTPLYGLFKTAYNMIRPPEHISMFTARSFANLLQAGGMNCEATFTYSPFWDQRNFFMYAVLSLLKNMGIMSSMRSKQNPDSTYGLAAPISLKSNGLLDKAFKTADYASRVMNVLFHPVVKVLDTRKMGLLLVAIGRKPG